MLVFHWLQPTVGGQLVPSFSIHFPPTKCSIAAPCYCWEQIDERTRFGFRLTCWYRRSSETSLDVWRRRQRGLSATFVCPLLASGKVWMHERIVWMKCIDVGWCHTRKTTRVFMNGVFFVLKATSDLMRVLKGRLSWVQSEIKFFVWFVWIC